MLRNVTDNIDDLEVAIGQRIRAVRTEKNLSQDTVAERMGVEQPTVSKWEKGNIPAVTVLVRLADVLDVPLGQILQPALNHGSGRHLEEDPLVLLDRLRDALHREP